MNIINPDSFDIPQYLYPYNQMVNIQKLPYEIKVIEFGLKRNRAGNQIHNDGSNCNRSVKLQISFNCIKSRILCCTLL